MTLWEGVVGSNYEIGRIMASEEGMKDFLFSLGCYPGEETIIISRLRSHLIINVKDARYSIDEDLARAIVVAQEQVDKKAI